MARHATVVFAATVIAGVIHLGSNSIACGQSPSASASTSEPTSAADSESPPATATPRLATSVTVSPAGIQRHVTGKWATVAVNAVNRSDVDVEETVAVIIGDQPHLQYARRLWIPARASRQSWLPIQIPPELYPDQFQIEMTSIHLKKSDRGEEFESNVIGLPTTKRSLLLSWEPSRAALLFESRDSDLVSADAQDERFSHLETTLNAGRDSAVTSVQDLGFVYLSGSFLPASAKSLDSVDQIVIAGDRILDDTTGLLRLQTWLHSGGRLWIMVDQIDPEAVRAILGDAACYSVVDRVELNDFEIEQAAAFTSISKGNREAWSSETPVELVRVVVDTDDVHSRIDGWPAAFWKQVGQGEVLFTTLGARGWLNDNGPTLALDSLSSRFFVGRLDPSRPSDTMIPILDDEIGYSIPTRAAVASVLGMHLLFVVLAGGWLARRQRLQHLAIVVPLAAFIATGCLVAMGNRQTSAVQSTIATGQIARAIADTSQVQVESVAAIYSQQGRPLRITSSPNTTTGLDDDDLSGVVKRILWDDSGESNWQYVRQPPGVVRHVHSESVVELPHPWTVTGRFTMRGLEGRIEGLDAGRCEDAVIIAPAAPALAVNLDAGVSAAFHSGFDDVLSPDQFVDDKFMSEVQREHQELLRKWMASETSVFGREPVLLVWTDPINSGVTFDDDYVRRGLTLASIPIRLERLTSGADFRVPASFVRLEAHAGIRGTSAMFNAETGRWLDQMNKASETELRCVLPKVLLPCRLRRATVLIKVNAPSRTLSLKAFVDHEFVTLQQKVNPNGVLQFEIDRPDALRTTEDGGLLLAIAISETDEERQTAAAAAAAEAAAAEAAAVSEQSPEPRGEPEEPAMPSRSTWQIDYVHVDLEGTAL